MRGSHEHIMVITDGSLASLLACLLAGSELGGSDGAPEIGARLPILPWLAPLEAGLFHHVVPGETARQFVEHQVEAFSLGEMVIGDAPAPGLLAASQALLSAAGEAMARGCRRLIWPCAWGTDLDAIHAASERALAVGQLAALDGQGVDADGPAIETPFLDCTAEMLLQLADDLDAPLGSCWLNPHEAAALEQRPRGVLMAGEAGFAGDRAGR